MQQKQILKIQQVLIRRILLKSTNLTNLKSDVDKSDIDRLKSVLSNLCNLKIKADKTDVEKLVPVPVDLSKLIDVVKNVIKKDLCNFQLKNIQDKIPDITNLATNTTLNAKINQIKNERPNITKLATTAAHTTVKIKILDHSKRVNTPEFNKFTAERFAARLASTSNFNKQN